MLPKFSIDANRFTMTFFSAIRRAPCERLNADNSWKKLRREPDGERECKQKRIENRFVKVNIKRENRDHEK